MGRGSPVTLMIWLKIVERLPTAIPPTSPIPAEALAPETSPRSGPARPDARVGPPSESPPSLKDVPRRWKSPTGHAKMHFYPLCGVRGWIVHF
jgi:hypothetical protein